MEGSFSKWNTTLQDLSRIRADDTVEDIPCAVKCSWFDVQNSIGSGALHADHPLSNDPGLEYSLNVAPASSSQEMSFYPPLSSNTAHADSVSFLLNTTPNEPPDGRYDPFFKMAPPSEKISSYSYLQDAKNTPPCSILDSFVGSWPRPADDESIHQNDSESVDEEQTHLHILLEKLNEVFTLNGQEEDMELQQEKQLLCRLEEVLSDRHDATPRANPPTRLGKPLAHSKPRLEIEKNFEIINPVEKRNDWNSQPRGPLQLVKIPSKSMIPNASFPTIEYETILVTEEEKEIEDMAEMISDRYLSMPYLNRSTSTPLQSASL